MTVKRIPASQFAMMEGCGITPQDASDHDFAIRSGKCPNDGAVMTITPDPCPGQECPVCKFWCNSLPDREAGH